MTSGVLVLGDPIANDREDIFYAEVRQQGISASQFFLLVDLNGNPTWKHPNGTKLKITSIRGVGIKTNAGARWIVRAGVVARIDATDADVIYFVHAGISLLDTSELSSETGLEMFFPIFVPLEVVSEEIPKLTTNGKLTGQAITNAVAITDASGGTTIPEVGDLIIKAELQSGSSSFDFGYSVAYRVDP